MQYCLLIFMYKYECKIFFFCIAIEGEDFSPVGDFQIVFENTLTTSSAVECAQVNLTADGVVEGEEEFLVTVFKVTPSFVMSDSGDTVSVLITDSDSESTLYYE